LTGKLPSKGPSAGGSKSWGEEKPSKTGGEVARKTDFRQVRKQTK